MSPSPFPLSFGWLKDQATKYWGVIVAGLLQTPYSVRWQRNFQCGYSLSKGFIVRRCSSMLQMRCKSVASLVVKSACILVLLRRQCRLLKSECGGGESELGRGVWNGASARRPPLPQARLCNYALFCLPARPPPRPALRSAAGMQEGRPGMRSICRPRKGRLAAAGGGTGGLQIIILHGATFREVA